MTQLFIHDHAQWAGLPSCLVVLARVVDDCGLAGDWQVTADGDAYLLRRDDARWSLDVASSAPLRLIVECAADQRRWQLVEGAEGFSFARVEND